MPSGGLRRGFLARLESRSAIGDAGAAPFFAVVVP